MTMNQVKDSCDAMLLLQYVKLMEKEEGDEWK